MSVVILETDSPAPVSRRKTYGVFFTELLRNAGLPADVPIAAYDVVSKQEYPSSLAGVAGIVLTGSKHNCYDDDEWILKLLEFVKSAYRAEIPLVGICFGHQIIGRALGAPTGPSPGGWEVASTKVQLTALGQQLLPEVVQLNEAEAVAADDLYIMQMHRDAVLELPPGTELLATNQSCAVQGFYQPGRILAFQGHPEFDGEYETQLIDLRTGALFTSHDAQEYLTRVHVRNDGPLIAKALVRFLERKSV